MIVQGAWDTTRKSSRSQDCSKVPVPTHMTSNASPVGEVQMATYIAKLLAGMIFTVRFAPLMCSVELVQFCRPHLVACENKTDDVLGQGGKGSQTQNGICIFINVFQHLRVANNKWIIFLVSTSQQAIATYRYFKVDSWGNHDVIRTTSCMIQWSLTVLDMGSCRRCCDWISINLLHGIESHFTWTIASHRELLEQGLQSKKKLLHVFHGSHLLDNEFCWLVLDVDLSWS